MVNFGWDLLASLGHPCKFQQVSHLGSVTARHSASGRHPNFAGRAPPIWQGGHHVGHWPTFLVVIIVHGSNTCIIYSFHLCMPSCMFSVFCCNTSKLSLVLCIWYSVVINYKHYCWYNIVYATCGWVVKAVTFVNLSSVAADCPWLIDNVTNGTCQALLQSCSTLQMVRVLWLANVHC